MDLPINYQRRVVEDPPTNCKGSMAVNPPIGDESPTWSIGRAPMIYDRNFMRRFLRVPAHTRVGQTKGGQRKRRNCKKKRSTRTKNTTSKPIRTHEDHVAAAKSKADYVASAAARRFQPRGGLKKAPLPPTFKSTSWGGGHQKKKKSKGKEVEVTNVAVAADVVAEVVAKMLTNVVADVAARGGAMQREADNVVAKTKVTIVNNHYSAHCP